MPPKTGHVVQQPYVYRLIIFRVEKEVSLIKMSHVYSQNKIFKTKDEQFVGCGISRLSELAMSARYRAHWLTQEVKYIKKNINME
jgi:hypothetical protein